jgi:hypothetical protein
MAQGLLDAAFAGMTMKMIEPSIRNTRQVSLGWLTHGCAGDAASAFASYRHDAALALGSHGPRTGHADQFDL